MKYIITIIKWVFSKNSLSTILFGLNLTKTLFKDAKNLKMLEKVNQATEYIDKVNKLISNDDTARLAGKINNDKKHLNNFGAAIVKNKHGKGNDGIVLSYEKDGISVQYDPTDGSFSSSIGFGF